jgi:hypothetical protein
MDNVRKTALVIWGPILAIVAALIGFTAISSAESEYDKCVNEWNSFNKDNPQTPVNVEDTCKGKSKEDTGTGAASTTSTTTGGSGGSTSSSSSSTSSTSTSVPATTTTVQPISAGPTGTGTGTRFNVTTGGANTPNMDSVSVNGCDGRKSNHGVYMQSGENRRCTATVTDVPAGSVMTVDAIAFKFNDRVYTNYIKAFEVSGSVTIELNNGAALIGTSDRARDRYCSIAETTDENLWAAFKHEPLSSWTPCPSGSGSSLQSSNDGSSGNSGSGGSSNTRERRVTGPAKVADFKSGEVVQASSVCMGGKFSLNSDGVPTGCPGGEKLDEKPCMVATKDGQAFNGVINPNMGEGGCDK